MKPSEILRGAIAQINERGWGRNRMINLDGSCCAWGAICLAVGMPVIEEDQPTYNSAGDVIGSRTRMFIAGRFPDEANEADYILGRLVGGSITSWNDRTGQTKKKVIAGLEKAAIIAEEQGK